MISFIIYCKKKKNHMKTIRWYDFVYEILSSRTYSIREVFYNIINVVGFVCITSKNKGIKLLREWWTVNRGFEQDKSGKRCVEPTHMKCMIQYRLVDHIHSQRSFLEKGKGIITDKGIENNFFLTNFPSPMLYHKTL